MRHRIISAHALMAALSGCATSSWHHSAITDKEASERQFIIDNGYCTQVAQGAAPMPQIPSSPTSTTSNFNMQGSTYDASTGQRTYGNYSGQVMTSPSGGLAGGFASGFSSGARLGLAMRARQAQDQIHKGCMYRLGWTEE